MANNNSLYNMGVIVSVEDKDFKSKVDRLKQNIRKTSKEMQIKAGVLAPTGEFEQLQKNIAATEKRLEALKRKQESAISTKSGKSNAYTRLEKTIAKAETELDELINKQILWEEVGVDIRSNPFQNLDKEITEAGIRLDGLKEKLESMEQSGEAYKDIDGWQRRREAIEQTENELNAYIAKQREMEVQGSAYRATGNYSNLATLNANLRSTFSSIAGVNSRFSQMWARIRQVTEATGPARSGIKKFAVGAKNDLKVVWSWIVKIGRGFGTVRERLKKIFKTGKSIGGLNNQFKRGIFMGAGLRPLARLASTGILLYGVVRGLVDGFKNLSQYSAQTNSDLSMLKSSLITLKNALATAFAPILTVIAPIINTFIQLLTRAATAVAHFTAAFTGKSSVVVAKQVYSDFASGVADSSDSAGSAMGKANSAAEEYKKTLLGFDKINKLDDITDSSGSGSGGSGSGVGGLSPSDMFETVEVDSGARGLIDRIKDAWEKADFTDFGNLLGDKINYALANIPWEKIKGTAERLAKSLTSFINGFLTTTDWQLVGKTVAEGLNTAITFAYTLVSTFDWAAAGKSVADTISGFFKNLDWAKVAKTISEGIKGALKSLSSFLKNLDWGAIVDSLITFLTNIDWLGVLKGVAELIWSALKSALDLVITVIEIPWKFAKWLAKDKDAELEALYGGGTTETILPVQARVDNVQLNLNKKQYLLGGFRAGLYTTEDKIALKDKIINLMTARFTDKVDAIPLASKILDVFKARLVEKIDAIKDKVLDLFKANITEKTDSISNKNLSGFTASVGSIRDNISNKLLGSFTANLTAKRDSISSRLLGGFTAQITSVSVASKAKSLVLAISGKADGGLYKNGSWHPVTMAATGGVFNSGQVFVAREAGPELVGRIGSATGVMNNDQIVSSVAAGVARAVASVMNGKANNTTVVLEGDAQQLFRVIREEANTFTNTTGQAPFPV